MVLRMNTESFGEWLRRSREARGWSQAKLADISGVSQPQIWNIEAGKSVNPQERTRRKLSEALGEPVPAPVENEAQEEERVAGLGVLTDFDPYEDELLPECSGVYVFYDITDRPVYVGKAPRRSIRDRVKDHYDKFWFKRPIVDRASYIEINDEQLCSQVEQVLIKFLKSNALLNKHYVERD
jgi:transcriptional regulator with XRE-family HTH domain